MSGIIGLLDPGGPDPALLARAAHETSYRGRPVIVTEGAVALGVLTADGEASGIVRRNGYVTVSDARIDAVLPGTLAARLRGVEGSELLDAILAEAGPEGLQGVAADYAVARFDPRSGWLTLVRDAFGLRPLYWARSGPRFGFASDPEVLVRMGIASGDPDLEAIRSALFERAEYGDRTSLAGIRRVVPGRWVRLAVDGRTATGRWFHPEAVEPENDLTLEDAGKQAREAIIAATASRTTGKRVALMLSAGRDSSSVAVALAEAGVRASCFTYVLESDDPSEATVARELALSLGHEWRELRVAPRLDPSRVAEIARLVGRPVKGVAAPIQLAMYDAVRDSAAEVVLAGEGGDLLFSAFPIAVLDLIRHGRVRAAVSAARGFHHYWTYPYAVTAKVGLRAILPRSVIAFRERIRPQPPWLIRPRRPRVRVDRSDRSYLRDLLSEGPSSAPEIPERLTRFAGAVLSWPLCDLRVVRLALRIPVKLRVPHPAPKPLLREALLRDRDSDLVKAPLGDYGHRLAQNCRRDFPDAFGAASRAAELGIVRKDGLSGVAAPRWAWEALDLLGLEGWLEHLEDRDGS